MSSGPQEDRCLSVELTSLDTLPELSPAESPAVEGHISMSSEGWQEVDRLRAIVDSFAAGPIDLLRPSESLWNRLAYRIATESGGEPMLPATRRPLEPDWEDVAPGIACKFLATDTERGQVSMLVRLAPGSEYAPHHHAGIEEIYILHGELWIGDRKLHPGDYNRTEVGAVHSDVWSETGCTCVLIGSRE